MDQGCTEWQSGQFRLFEDHGFDWKYFMGGKTVNQDSFPASLWAAGHWYCDIYVPKYIYTKYIYQNI